MRGGASEADRICVGDVIARLSSINHPHQTPYATLVDGEMTQIRRGTSWIKRSLRRLVRDGLSQDEAGNVVAYAAGLHYANGGWTAAEVERLLRLRALAACEQLPS
jgi:hypothetical protein